MTFPVLVQMSGVAAEATVVFDSLNPDVAFVVCAPVNVLAPRIASVPEVGSVTAVVAVAVNVTAKFPETEIGDCAATQLPAVVQTYQAPRPAGSGTPVAVATLLIVSGVVPKTWAAAAPSFLMKCACPAVDA